jgi:lysophospholipase L1-like esterase
MSNVKHKRDWHREEFRVMVTLGESITAGGWSSSRERCWASRLATLISDVQFQPVKLVNSGIGANVISTLSPCYEFSGKPAANERLDKHVIAHGPDLLVISYGLNDARGGTPPKLFAKEMKAIINRIRENGQPLIVLLGPFFMTDLQGGNKHWSHGSRKIFHIFNKLISDIAQTKDCLFVDLLEAYGETEWMVHDDGVHANDLGHLIIANKVFEVLAQNCSGLAKHTKNKEHDIPPWRDESMLAADYGIKRPGNAKP